MYNEWVNDVKVNGAMYLWVEWIVRLEFVCVCVSGSPTVYTIA